MPEPSPGSVPASADARAYADAAAYAVAHAHTPAQAALLRAAIDGGWARTHGIGGERYRRFVRVPLAVMEAVCGDADRARPLLCALALLHAGMDTLDDLMDGDPRPWWAGRGVGQVLLAGATLVSALPQLAIAELDASPGTIAAMLRDLAHAGMVISAGQHADITADADRSVTVADLQAAVAAKSGEVHGLGAMLAARLGGASEDAVRAYARMGRAFGTASQFASDCNDAFISPEARDLRRGARTLPIVLSIGSVEGEARDQLEHLLMSARIDAAAREHARARLLSGDVVRACAVIIEIYCGRAYDALRDAGATGPHLDNLTRLIRDCSLVSD